MNNTSQTALKSMHRQSGAVLIFALAIMLLTGIIATTVMRTGVLEIKMVSNSQFKEEAFQVSEAVLNAISADQSNFVVAGDIGFKVCAVGSTDNTCNAKRIRITNAITTMPAGVDLEYFMLRKGPLFSPLPMRQSDTTASSASSFDIATFEVHAEYDGRDNGFGFHKVIQGVGIKVASAAQ